MDKLPAGFINAEFKRDHGFRPMDPEEKDFPYIEFKDLCVKCPDGGCEITLFIKPEFMDKTEGVYGYCVCGVKAGAGATIEPCGEREDDEDEPEEDSYRKGLGAALDKVMEEEGDED